MVPKLCPRGPLDPQNEVPGDPGEVPGDPRDPPETHPGQPGAALGSPGSPLGGHGVAQTAKVVILLKLSLILMNFGSPRVPPRGILFEALAGSAAEAAAPILSTVSDLRPTVYLFDLLYTSATAISASFVCIQHQRTLTVRGRIQYAARIPPRP